MRNNGSWYQTAFGIWAYSISPILTIFITQKEDAYIATINDEQIGIHKSLQSAQKNAIKSAIMLMQNAIFDLRLEYNS